MYTYIIFQKGRLTSMKVKQQLSTRLISMILSILILVSSLPIQTQAINYDERTRIIKSAISESKQIIMQNPMEGSTKSFPYKTEYQKLNGKQRQIYKKIKKTIENFEPLKLPKKYKLKDIRSASKALFNDYPLFNEYADYGYRKYTIPEITYYEFFTDGSHKLMGKLVRTEKQMKTLKRKVNQYTKKVDKYADMIVKGMPSGISTIDKYRYLAACLCYITKYNNTAANNTDKYYLPLESCPIKHRKAWSYDAAFTYGACVCEGYALAYNYLCRKANLYCIDVSGLLGEEAHAWNLVKLDKGTYYVDVTWMDSSVPNTEGWYKHFMKTQSELLEDNFSCDKKATGTYSFRDDFKNLIPTFLDNNYKNKYNSDPVTWSASKKNDINISIPCGIIGKISLVKMTPFKKDEYIGEYITGPTSKYNSFSITIKGDSQTLQKNLTPNGKKLYVKVFFDKNRYTDFTIVRED